ncbi:hypothetical protein [Cupriavidus numazuensis]|uniref:Ribbon-helix-helix protein CopG domain-containing protein n=1 Tax=Cupriavidus numazuensis TaxID=221992 RepID=A0ABN7PR15_9BURK|nr:hypothetical protein [Cupriavidus numazuensis]CAG2132316.1 hypothetical protein LMG26411_00595 [Cupriavidus numazuensis]
MLEEIEELLMSRTPFNHPLGKLTDSVKTDLPEVVGDIVTQKAREAGMTRAELVREIICHWALPDDMLRLAEQRRNVAKGNGARFEPNKD